MKNMCHKYHKFLRFFTFSESNNPVKKSWSKIVN